MSPLTLHTGYLQHCNVTQKQIRDLFFILRIFKKPCRQSISWSTHLMPSVVESFGPPILFHSVVLSQLDALKVSVEGSYEHKKWHINMWQTFSTNCHTFFGERNICNDKGCARKSRVVWTTTFSWTCNQNLIVLLHFTLSVSLFVEANRILTLCYTMVTFYFYQLTLTHCPHMRTYFFSETTSCTKTTFINVVIMPILFSNIMKKIKIHKKS